MENQNQSKFSDKGISTPIGILIIVVCGLLVGGILAWQFEWFKKGVEIPEVKVQREATDETANWQTYRNEKYGFEVKYPKDWERCHQEELLFKSPLIIIPSSTETPKEIMFADKSYKDFLCRTASIEFGKMEKKFSNLDDLKKYYRDLEMEEGMPDVTWEEIKEITFNGQPALQMKIFYAPAGRVAKLIQFIHKQEVYQIEIGNRINDITGEEIVNQILSTFKFLK